MNNRKHKYKAWDKTNNEWFMNGDAFDLDFSGSYGDFFFDNDHPCNMRDVDLEWVQFAGLTDKNGVEIYYDDIYLCGILKINRVVSKLTVAHWIIDMDKMNDPSSFVEVIGNIHQSPELLESKQ